VRPAEAAQQPFGVVAVADGAAGVEDGCRPLEFGDRPRRG
jgi:hypothetical protein